MPFEITELEWQVLQQTVRGLLDVAKRTVEQAERGERRLQRQILSLAALLGTTLGTLREKGLLTQEEEQRIFALADGLLPDSDPVEGTELLSMIVMASRQVGARDED